MPYWSRIAIWIVAACLLLALLGYMQFQWIGQVSDSQRAAARGALIRSLRLFADGLRYETGVFLTTFKWDADLDRPNRLDNYMRRHLLWHEVSSHGPAVKRILFYDTRPPNVGSLTEYIGEFRIIRAASWGEELDPVRDHIDEYGLPYGSERSGRWAATWMFHPQAATLYRPIMQWEPSSPTDPDAFVVRGYLVLQLDVDYLRDHLLPEVLKSAFRGMDGSFAYGVTVALDGRPLVHYERARVGPSGERGSADGTATFLPAPMPGPSEIGPPDRSLRMLLLDGGVPPPVRRAGGAQRVSLRDLGDIARLGRQAELQVTPFPSAARPALAASAIAPLKQIAAVPRLFATGDGDRRLVVEARHIGIPLEESMNARYMRSLALGVALLALLVGAMAMLAISGWKVARLTELRMEAAASQAHELRTPVAGITALADNMAGGMLGKDTKVVEYGELIRGLARRLGTNVDRMVEGSSTKPIRDRYSPRLLDVSRVVRSVVDRYMPVVAGAAFKVECSLADGLPMVRVDEEALRKSVGDLLSNAVKYGKPGHWVGVETLAKSTAKRQEVQVRIRDRGRGIPARESSTIFEPYYRMPEDASSSVPGSGLGLKLVLERVKLMGGRVSLESERGRGSVFTIHIPVDA